LRHATIHATTRLMSLFVTFGDNFNSTYSTVLMKPSSGSFNLARFSFRFVFNKNYRFYIQPLICCFLRHSALKALEALGGDDLIPFYGLIDGGREGEMFAELENYFYFAQLRSQGLETTEEREVSTSVKLDQVPFILRALGFYPTEQEVRKRELLFCLFYKEDRGYLEAKELILSWHRLSEGILSQQRIRH